MVFSAFLAADAIWQSLPCSIEGIGGIEKVGGGGGGGGGGGQKGFRIRVIPDL